MAAPALAIGTMAPVITVAGVIGTATAVVAVIVVAIVVVMGAATTAVTVDNKRALRRAAGRHSSRRAIRAGRPHRRRKRRRADPRRISAVRTGARRHRNNPSITTEAATPLSRYLQPSAIFPIPGGSYHLRKT